MTLPPLTLGTAGHIDHGKTALVRALTGVDTDRLPQERERGISIELGFARLELPSGGVLSVVDVPGHERFVRTMVAGATGIDLFMLVVAADDGVMPQTREHLAVLELLGIPAGVVALSKVDAVGTDEVAMARADVAALLAGGPYANAPVVEVSSLRGIGLDALRAELDAVARKASGRAAAGGPARLHVDRCFSLRGIGTVVTGTLWSGRIATGDEVAIEPGGRRARVRGVELHGERREHAVAGQRVALNLAGIERSEVGRGDVVVAGDEAPAPSYVLDVELRMRSGARALKPGARVHVHHGTRETPARVVPVESRLPGAEAEGLAQLRLERPLMAAAGDRFVVRSIAPADTTGGGRVLDPAAHKHGASEAHSRRLRALRSGDPLELLRLEIGSAASGVAAAHRAPDLDRLADGGEAIAVGTRTRRWFSPERLDDARAGLLAAVRTEEDPRPRSPAALAHAARLDVDGAAAVLETLADDGQVEYRDGGYLSAGTGPRRADPLAERLAALIASDGPQPRAAGALAGETGVSGPEAIRALDRLAAAGELVRLRPGLYYDPPALERIRQQIVSLCEREGAVTIATVRDRMGTSRKYAQALLEHLDAQRITRRVGDEHVLRRARRAPGGGSFH